MGRKTRPQISHFLGLAPAGVLFFRGIVYRSSGALRLREVCHNGVRKASHSRRTPRRSLQGLRITLCGLSQQFPGTGWHHCPTRPEFWPLPGRRDFSDGHRWPWVAIDGKSPAFNRACHANVTFENRMELFPIVLGKRVEGTSCVTASRDLSRNRPQNTAKQEFTRGML